MIRKRSFFIPVSFGREEFVLRGVVGFDGKNDFFINLFF
jgi:hypothetical protein